MEKEDVIKLRELANKATYTRRLADGTTVTDIVPLVIVCDNSLNCVDYHDGSVIWDDDNAVFVNFIVNGPDTVYQGKSHAMSFGSKIKAPLAAILVDYGEIQNFRLELIEEAYDNFSNGFTAMSAEEKEAVKKYYFEDLNMDNIIRRKQQISYMTQQKKDHPIEQQHYDDLDEYNRTVHTENDGPMAFY